MKSLARAKAHKKATYTIDLASSAILDETGNASAYLSNVVLQRDIEWRHALAFLQCASWTKTDLREAISQLKDSWMVTDWLTQPGVFALRADIEPVSPAEMRALHCIVREAATGNNAVMEAIDAMKGGGKK